MPGATQTSLRRRLFAAAAVVLLLAPIGAVLYLALPGGTPARPSRAGADAALGTSVCREQPRRVEIDEEMVDAFAVICEERRPDSRALTEAAASSVASGFAALAVDEAPETASGPSWHPPPQVVSGDRVLQRRSAMKPRRPHHAARPRPAEWGTVPSHQKFGP